MTILPGEAFFMANPAWPVPVNVQVYPDAILTQTNSTGAVGDVDDDPDAGGGDTSWTDGTGAVVLRVSFPTPTRPPEQSRTQKFRVRVRPGS